MKHRSPGQILKSFIRSTSAEEKEKIKGDELKKLRACFTFLADTYRQSDLGKSRLAKDAPHFYTMVTSLIASGKLAPTDGAPPDYAELRRKLSAFAKLLLDDAEPPADEDLARQLLEYKKAAARQTTNPGQRDIRQQAFLAIIEKL